MSTGLPTIDITFTQKAVTAIERSQRGIACVVLQDNTLSESDVISKVYKYATDISERDYTKENLAILKRCFLVAVNKLIVLSVPSTVDFSGATAVLENLSYNYVCTTVEDWQQSLVNYIVNKNTKTTGKKYIAIVSNATTADSMYVINLKNKYVVDKDSKSTISMASYLPRLTAILANLPMNRSCTYYELEDLEDIDLSFITVEQDVDYWINKGYLVLFSDEDVVKIARGVNSLTTFTSTETEDMRKIIIVESMNIILEDIHSAFKESYVGKYKNSYDNQCLLISAINTYFRKLAKDEILDSDFDNKCQIDIEAQRDAWMGIGKTEAEDWDENKVKQMSFKSFVYLSGNIKILDAIEDLKFPITME